MTTILLIRHGHTDWIGKALAGRTSGVRLSDAGRQQAVQLANRLRGMTLQAIYSSPLERTLETAEPLGTALNLPIQAKPRLMEVDFGEWTGKTLQELESNPGWKRFNSLRSTFRAPGGERLPDVQVRMIDELEDLRTAHPDGAIAVVSHQDAIKAALVHYAGIPLDLFHRFEIHPASVSILQLADWGPRVVTINNTGEF